MLNVAMFKLTFSNNFPGRVLQGNEHIFRFIRSLNKMSGQHYSNTLSPLGSQHGASFSSPAGHRIPAYGLNLQSDKMTIV